MSSALAIAAVTATLKDLLNEGLLNHDLSVIGSFAVTSQPPDRVTTGSTEANQLNVFLYQVTANPGWRNVGLPSRDGRGSPITNTPLALDLHYLLTAYGAQDLNAEVLLGYAMQLLHETPMLTRQQLRTVLGAPSPVDGSVLPGPFGSLSAIDLADQAELIKITPVFLSSDDLSKLWTAMQARYRTSMAYLVSVVLIQREGGERIAPPVLRRGPDDRGPTAQAMPPPSLQAIRNLASPLLRALRLGDDVGFDGNNLAGSGAPAAVFENPQLGITQELPLAAGPASGEMRAHIPSTVEDATVAAGWAAGVYAVSMRVLQPGVPAWTTNAVPLALAPIITAAPLIASAGSPIDLVVTCMPRVRALQAPGVRLLFGSAELLPASIDTPADATAPSTLHFSVSGMPAGSYPLRLRVGGIDSLPIVPGSGGQASFGFDPQQTVVVT